ncbi:MAG: hypothetical protein U0469_03130 [Candidatus Paceibacterota bacterium]|jgi:hypothetical protein
MNRPHLNEHDKIAKALLEFEEWHNSTKSNPDKKKLIVTNSKKKGICYCYIKIHSSVRPIVGSDKLEHLAHKKALEIASRKTGYKKRAKIITNEKKTFVRPVLRKETA